MAMVWSYVTITIGLMFLLAYAGIVTPGNFITSEMNLLNNSASIYDGGSVNLFTVSIELIKNSNFWLIVYYVFAAVAFGGGLIYSFATKSASNSAGTAIIIVALLGIIGEWIGVASYMSANFASDEYFGWTVPVVHVFFAMFIGGFIISLVSWWNGAD